MNLKRWKGREKNLQVGQRIGERVLPEVVMTEVELLEVTQRTKAFVELGEHIIRRLKLSQILELVEVFGKLAEVVEGDVELLQSRQFANFLRELCQRVPLQL